MKNNSHLAPLWIEALLNDKSITDICLNGIEGVFIDQGEGMRKVELALPHPSNEELKKWILTELEMTRGTWDAKRPFINFIISSGHRAHAIFPPLSQHGVLISLRRLSDKNKQNQEGKKGEEHWRKSERSYSYLKDRVREKSSMIVAGSTGSGKTTLVNDLLEEIDPNERIIALEDTAELAPNHPHFLSLVSRPPNADGFGEVTLRDLLKETLRMRPDRIILGECRGAEVMDLLQALNTGHEGALATLHAGSAEKTLDRLELLSSLSSDLPISVLRGFIASGIELIVNVIRSGGDRLISEIHEFEKVDHQILLKKVIV